LFSDPLDGSDPNVSVGFHDERFAPNTNQVASDFSVLTAFGLAGLADVASPGFPTLDPSADEGLIGRVNLAQNLPGDAPERVALNFSPNVTLNSNTTDWVMTVNAYAYDTGGDPDTTLSFLAGMSSDSSRVNWQGGTDTAGLFWSLTTDGRADNDLLALQGSPGGPPSIFRVQDIDGNDADINYPANTFNDRWVTLAVGSHDNTPFFAIRTHEADGFPDPWQVLDSFGNAGGPTAGTPFFGVEDPFNSANDNLGVIFRNASVSTLRPGDTDLDGDVDFADAATVLAEYSDQGVAADTGNAVPPGFDSDLWLWTLGDFDQDRDVDFDDMLQVVANYDRFGDTVLPPGQPDVAASLIVDLASGDLSIETDGDLLGVRIQGENLEGPGDGFDLTLEHTAEQFAALSLTASLEPGESLGLRTAGVGDPSAWSFRYGAGGAAQQGTVVFVPEPAAGVALLMGFGLVRRRR
jgi:hypothetical protein